MAEARQRDAWNHTSHLLAMLVNINRDPKTPAVKPADCNPFTAPPAPKPLKMPLKMVLKQFEQR